MHKGEWLFQRDGSTRWTYAWANDPTDATSRAQRLLPKEVRSERDAKRYVEEKRAELRAHGAPRKAAPLIRELAEKWFKLREDNERIRESTRKDNRSHFAVHILKALGDLRADRIDGPTLRAFARDLRKKVAPYTARNVFATLSIFLDDVQSEGWAKVPKNFARADDVRKELNPPAPRAGRSQKLRIADVAVGQALVSSPLVPPERRVRYVVGFTGGQRDGELAGATWGHVDLDTAIPVMRIKQNLAYKGEGGYAKIGKLKTEYSDRVIPLHPAAVEALRWWKAEGWVEFVGRDPGPADHIFPACSGKPSRPKSAAFLRRDLAAVGAAPDVDGHALTFHAIRRSFASWLNAAGVPSDARAHLLGHTPREVGARHYTEQDMPQLRDYVGRIQLEWRMV